jgi:hypothetical protein
MRKVLLATIHVQHGRVIVDGSLNLHTYIELMHLMFPDDLIKDVIMENTMVASDGYATKLEICLVKGVLKGLKVYNMVDT